MAHTRKLLIFLTITVSTANINAISVIDGINMALGTTLAFSAPALLKVSMFGSHIPSIKDKQRFDLLEPSLKPEDALNVPRSDLTILKKDHSLMSTKVRAILKRVKVKNPQSVRCYPFDMPGMIMAAGCTFKYNGVQRWMIYETNIMNDTQGFSIIANEEQGFTEEQVQEKYELRVIEGMIGHEGRHLANHDALIGSLILLGTPTIGILANLYFKGELPRIPQGLAIASWSWILTALYMVRAEKRADLESCQILGVDHTRAMSKFFENLDKLESVNGAVLQTFPMLYKLLTMHPPHRERSAYLQLLAEQMERDALLLEETASAV